MLRRRVRAVGSRRYAYGGLAGELVRGLSCLGEPGLAGFDRRSSGIWRPSSRCRPPLPWRDRPRARRSTSRAGRPSPTARAWASGLERRQRSSSAPRIVCSTFLKRPSSSFMSAAAEPCRPHPTCSARSRKASSAVLESVTGSSASASARSASLHLGVGRVLGVELDVGLVARAEEGVLSSAEPLPQRVVDVLGRPAGGLPLRHQVAVGAGRRAPVGRRRPVPRPRRRASP